VGDQFQKKLGKGCGGGEQCFTWYDQKAEPLAHPVKKKKKQPTEKAADKGLVETTAKSGEERDEPSPGWEVENSGTKTEMSQKQSVLRNPRGRRGIGLYITNLPGILCAKSEAR